MTDFTFSGIPDEIERIYDQSWEEPEPNKRDPLECYRDQVALLETLLLLSSDAGKNMQGALQWLLDDAHDSERVFNPENGAIWDSVANAAKALKACGGSIPWERKDKRNMPTKETDPSTICPRCGSTQEQLVGSIFESKLVCVPCHMDEDNAPHYAVARAIEETEMLAGNRAFPGVWETDYPTYTTDMQRDDRAYLFETHSKRQVISPPRKPMKSFLVTRLFEYPDPELLKQLQRWSKDIIVLAIDHIIVESLDEMDWQSLATREDAQIAFRVDACESLEAAGEHLDVNIDNMDD